MSRLRDYRKILSREREKFLAGEHRKYNLFRYHQGTYYEKTLENGEEPCLRHARSIGYALERLPLDFPGDQLFFGGVETFSCTVLPPEITEEDYRKKIGICNQYCNRHFGVGWDHTAPDYRTLMERGLGDFIRRAETAFAGTRSPMHEAMLLSLQAVSNFFLRAAEVWRQERPEESERLRRIAFQAPETFAEALQLMWGIFVVLESQWRSHNALARMDQYLYASFKREGVDRETALDMICHIFSKVEEFHEVTNICIGGVKPDGSDAVNELSFLILEAVDRVHRASTNLSARVHKDTSDEFLRACIRLIATGIGFPAIMNDSVYIASLQKCGIPLEDARDYALFGCVEGNIPGRAPAWSDSMIPVPECLLSTLENIESFASYDELFQAFSEAYKKQMQDHLQEYDQILQKWDPARFPDPLLSALTRSCIERGKDINAGGADFPRQHGVGMVGTATLADSLAAVKKLVFEEKKISGKELLDALHNNFEGAEVLRKTLISCAPKYGNDDPYVDSIFADIVKLCGETAQSLRTCDGGYFKSLMASNINNIPQGKALPATPDGRFAYTPLSDAASPTGGMDRNGPTAFMNSITTPDYSAQNCTVVNMRFLPEMFETEAGYERMLVLLKKFIAGEGHEIQFNVTNNQTLLDAIENPEQYGDLLVRVSGFSAFFTKLSPEVQQDIIRRNAHGK